MTFLLSFFTSLGLFTLKTPCAIISLQPIQHKELLQ
nr:MAG TPA: hypothetical protein [Caudoviricetes sp.]